MIDPTEAFDLTPKDQQPDLPAEDKAADKEEIEPIAQSTEAIDPSTKDQQTDLSAENNPADEKEIEPIAQPSNKLRVTIIETQSTLPRFYTEILPRELLLNLADYLIISPATDSFNPYSIFPLPISDLNLNPVIFSSPIYKNHMMEKLLSLPSLLPEFRHKTIQIRNHLRIPDVIVNRDNRPSTSMVIQPQIDDEQSNNKQTNLNDKNKNVDNNLSITNTLPMEPTSSADYFTPSPIDEKLNNTQNNLNTLLMLSYNIASPEAQLAVIEKAFSQQCQHYIDMLRHKQRSIINHREFLELGKILTCDIYQSNFEQIPALEYVVSTNNIKFFDAICSSLMQVIYENSKNKSHQENNKEHDLLSDFFKNYNRFIIIYTKILDIILYQRNAFFMQWIIENLYTYKIDYLTRYIEISLDNNILQKFSADILKNYTTYALDLSYAINAAAIQIPDNKFVTELKVKHGLPSKTQFQRVRKTIMALLFRIMPLYENDSQSSKLKYVISISLNDCESAIDFIFSIRSEVYTAEKKLQDMLLAFIGYTTGQKRVELIQYAMTSYQLLPHSLQLHQFIDFNTLDIILLIYMHIQHDYDQKKLQLFTYLVNEYFRLNNLNNNAEETLKTIIYAGTNGSEYGKIFLNNNQLKIWFENNLTTENAGFYLIAASIRGSFDIVSAILDLQRKSQNFPINRQLYLYTLHAALQKNHSIVCRLLIDSLDFYFVKGSDFYLSISGDSLNFLKLMFNAIKLNHFDIFDLLYQYAKTRELFEKDLDLYIVRVAIIENEIEVILYFLNKMSDRIEHLLTGFKGDPTMEPIFKLHKFLITQPSILKLSFLLDNFELEECINLFINVLKADNIQTIVFPYLTAILTDKFPLVKLKLDKFIHALLDTDRLRDYRPPLITLLNIIQIKYPELVRKYHQKFPGINREATHTNSLDGNSIKLNQFASYLHESNTITFDHHINHWLQEKIDRIASLQDELNELDKEWREKLKKQYFEFADEAHQHGTQDMPQYMRLYQQISSTILNELYQNDADDDESFFPEDMPRTPTERTPSALLLSQHSVFSTSPNFDEDHIAAIALGLYENSEANLHDQEPVSSVASDADTDYLDQESDSSNKLNR